MSSDVIEFGTDGWRDIIADRFTFENVRRVARAYGEHLLAHGGGRVLVGYDTRFLSGRFARSAAQELRAAGLDVALSETYLPTPALSFAVKQYGAAGGVMITASHNPASWNGVKLKGSFGGSASDATYRSVSDLLARVKPVARPAAGGAGGSPGAAHIDLFDVRSDYYRALAAQLSVDSLALAPAPLLHDAVGGAAAGWLAGFFRFIGLQGALTELRAEPSPTFHGVVPEPIPRNLALTMRRMTSGSPRALFAAVTDGDGDRLGVVLNGGAYFNSHQIFAVLLDHLARPHAPGAVVKSFTVSRLLERLAELRGRRIITTRVGFKHVANAMLEESALLGGEESGGVAIGAHLPERDALLSALLLMEAVVEGGASLGERFAELERETGMRHAYDRADLRLGAGVNATAALKSFGAPPGQLAGREVAGVERLDGVKLNFADGAWLLARASGTEPLLRLYCEASSEGEVSELLEAGAKLIRRTPGE